MINSFVACESIWNVCLAPAESLWKQWQPSLDITSLTPKIRIIVSQRSLDAGLTQVWSWQRTRRAAKPIRYLQESFQQLSPITQYVAKQYLYIIYLTNKQTNKQTNQQFCAKSLTGVLVWCDGNAAEGHRRPLAAGLGRCGGTSCFTRWSCRWNIVGPTEDGHPGVEVEGYHGRKQNFFKWNRNLWCWFLSEQFCC